MGRIIELSAFEKLPKNKTSGTPSEAPENPVVEFKKTPERMLGVFRVREEKLRKKLQMLELAHSTSGDREAVLEKCRLLQEETRAYLMAIAAAEDAGTWAGELSDKLTKVQVVANEMNWRANDIIREITYGKKTDESQ